MKIPHQGKILAASIALTVGTAGYVAHEESKRRARPFETPASYVMPIDQGQATLEMLVKDPRLENFLDVVETVVYDPGFVKYEKRLRNDIAEARAEGDVSMLEAVERKLALLPQRRNGIAFATAYPAGRGRGVKSILYFGDDFFEYLTGEDQVLVIGHEQVHALRRKYGKTLSEDAERKLLVYSSDVEAMSNIMRDPVLSDAFEEAMAFGVDITKIREGRVVASAQCRERTEEQFHFHRMKLYSAASESGLRGKVAQAMLDSLPVKD